MQIFRVAIAGATGYAGEELIRILLQHSAVKITALAASAEREGTVALSEAFPRFAGSLNLQIEPLDSRRLSKSADFIFLALPHGFSMDLVPGLLTSNCRVVDLGGDFRLKDSEVFTHWYGRTHTHPELLKEAVYGISELRRDAIEKSRLVANPGCYATSIILPSAPLLQEAFVETKGIIVDAKSGISGAGRKAAQSGAANENIWAYKVDKHQHVPEVVQALSHFTKDGVPSFCFVPQVVSMKRGILSMLYFRLKRSVSRQQVRATYEAMYKDEPFVRLRPEGCWPQVRDVVGTNYCDIAFQLNTDHGMLIVCSVIDNLIKGAAGQAVQNFNIMAGLPETTGLL